MRRLDAKVAIITGGANGIGRGIGLRLAEEGASVGLVDKDGAELANAVAEIEAAGGRAIAIELDCTAPSAPIEAIDRTEEQFGPINILVNNVGQGARHRKSTFLDSTEEIWRFIIELNLFTTMRFSHPMAKRMVDRGAGGRIISIASEFALLGPIMSHDYAAAKAGILGFTRSVARELGPHNITVNAILPGPILTRALKESSGPAAQEAMAGVLLPFVGEPSDIAAVAAMLASEDGRYITGQSILSNGGHWFH